jgi:hypothetical protein
LNVLLLHRVLEIGQNRRNYHLRPMLLRFRLGVFDAGSVDVIGKRTTIVKRKKKAVKKFCNLPLAVGSKMLYYRWDKHYNNTK